MIENELACEFGPVIDCLERATGTEWLFEHTGGGCFWLCTRFGPERDDWWNMPTICVTWGEGPFGAGDLLADERDHEGWMIGGYRDMDGKPEGDFLVECSTEELPMKVREMFVEMGGTP